MPAPRNPWIARHRIICSIDRGEPAQEARDGEAGGGNRKQHPRAERARQETGQRNRDHFRDQIRGLDPGYLGRACRQAGLDFAERRRDHLDVQDRHEHAEHHDEKRKQPARRDAFGRRRGGGHHRRRGGGGVGHDLLRSERADESGARPDGKTIAGGSWPARRGRLRCRHRLRPRGYRRWRRPTCRRAAGSAWRHPSARAREPAAAARSW